MITCSKCGARVGVTGPCKTCAKLNAEARHRFAEDFGRAPRIYDPADVELVAGYANRITAERAATLSVLFSRGPQ